MAGDSEVTLRTLSLGARDDWSGWRAKTFTPSTIDMLIVLKGSYLLTTIGGFYPVGEATGFTLDAVVRGCQILDKQGNYWDVETVEPKYLFDSLMVKACNMNHARMYQADPGATTWTKTRASDARYRTKLWMDTNLRDTQITKDDDATKADFAVLFNEPPYPIDLEFRGDSNMEGLFVVGQPVSEPLPDLDQIIRNYTDHVPIHHMTIDSTGCSGSALQHKMIAELQYITQEFSEGSQRSLERRSPPTSINLGGMWLYDVEYVLSYTRAASV